MDYNDAYLQRVIQLSRDAVAAGSHPFAALLELDGEIVLEALNTVVPDNDPTRHGEINLLQQAYKQLSSEDIARSTIYTNLEPCAMCAGAIYWSGISKVVYGASSEQLTAIFGKRLAAKCEEVFSRGNRHIEVIGPLRQEEAIAPHIEYWNKTKNRGPGVYHNDEHCH